MSIFQRLFGRKNADAQPIPAAQLPPEPVAISWPAEPKRDGRGCNYTASRKARKIKRRRQKLARRAQR